jgi:6-phosphogluconate dehydrogenase
MQLGMIGLRRMGANMAMRQMGAGHAGMVYDRNTQAARGTASPAAFISKLKTPRAIWLMLPAAIVDSLLGELVLLLQPGDIRRGVGVKKPGIY